MTRALVTVFILALAVPAWADETPPAFPVAARISDAQQRQQQSLALAAELERELSLARFSAQAAQKEIEALREIARRDADAAEKAKAEATAKAKEATK